MDQQELAKARHGLAVSNLMGTSQSNAVAAGPDADEAPPQVPAAVVPQAIRQVRAI